MGLHRNQTKNYEMDMCKGPLLSKIVVFAMPLMLSGILQLLFNAADIVVVGRYAGSQSLAAVGSTSSLINLLVNAFIGLSIGTNVLVAQSYGAQKLKDLEEIVHTSILLGMICGGFLTVLGICIAGTVLTWMGTPDDVLPLSVLYIRIFFLGVPATLVYNFGAATLRAVGDTKRPLYFLFFAGVINVCLNLIFVIAFSMGVAGVALATVVSQYVSAFLVVRCLMGTDAPYRLIPRNLRIVKGRMVMIARIGIPAGLQGMIFNISNVLIQSSVNSFGSIAMAGNTAASNIEGFVYTSMNAIYQTALSFTSQNCGARKYDRVSRILWYCLGLVLVVGIVMGNGAVLLGHRLLGIYSSEADVIQYGMYRMRIIGGTYFICGLMDVMVGMLRGMGRSVVPMFISIAGACGLRVIWIFTVFAMNRTPQVLYTSYPVSWTITLIAYIVYYSMVWKAMKSRQERR